MLSGKRQKTTPDTREQDIQALLHELQVYHLELEVQNEELYRSQEELEQERMRFKRLFDLAPVGYFILSNVCVILECNDTGLGMLDVGRARTIGKRFTHFLEKNESDSFYHFIRKVITTQKSQTVQLKIFSGNDTFLHAQVEGTAITDPATGEMQCYLAVVDITEKINAAMQQREMKERMEMALAASSTGTWGINMRSKAVEVDDFAKVILGLAAGKFDGKYKSFINLVHPGDRDKVDEQLQRAMHNEKDVSIEFRIQADDKLRHVEARAHMMSEYTSGPYFAGTVTDITERKMLEDETIKMRMNQQREILKAVFDTQENERKRISIALHDSVGQLLYATKISLDLDGTVTDPFPQIKKASQLLDNAIKETRDISFQLIPSILNDFGLEAAVDEMIKRVSTPTLKISFTYTGIDPRFEASAEIFIFRILQELVNNIMKHSKATEASIELYKNRNRLFIRVSDNGIGFNSKDEAQRNGTGIYSIRNRVSLYNGSLSIESGEGKGTQVTVILDDLK